MVDPAGPVAGVTVGATTIGMAAGETVREARTVGKVPTRGNMVKKATPATAKRRHKDRLGFMKYCSPCMRRGSAIRGDFPWDMPAERIHTLNGAAPRVAAPFDSNQCNEREALNSA